MNKPFKVRIHIASPVHLGCDDVYEPTGFVIDRKLKKLVHFDPYDFVDSLSSAERKKFTDICGKGTIESILEILKFMDGKSDSSTGRQINISDGLIDNLQKVLAIPLHDSRRIKQELNKFIISRTSYLPHDELPYLPGTGIKGALRSGYLNYLSKQRKPTVSSRNVSSNELVERLLGGRFDTDPFRLVLVSDMLPANPPSTRIAYAVNKKKRRSEHEPRGPVQILEIISEGSLFEGSVSIQPLPAGAKMERPINADLSFFQHVHEFYWNELKKEEVVLKEVQIPAVTATKLEEQFGERLGTSAFLIRIGRHSGAECVTIDSFRNIKVLGKQGERPRQLPYSTTTWLASDEPNPSNNSGLLPFGWALLEVLDFDGGKLYPEREIAGKLHTNTGHAKALMASKPAPEVIEWNAAVLSWSPGNSLLSAMQDGKKAEVKLDGNKGFVPEALHGKLFKKKEAVKAKVCVEALGNSFIIVTVETLT